MTKDLLNYAFLNYLVKRAEDTAIKQPVTPAGSVLSALPRPGVATSQPTAAPTTQPAVKPQLPTVRQNPVPLPTRANGGISRAVNGGMGCSTHADPLAPAQTLAKCSSVKRACSKSKPCGACKSCKSQKLKKVAALIKIAGWFTPKQDAGLLAAQKDVTAHAGDEKANWDRYMKQREVSHSNYNSLVAGTRNRENTAAGLGPVKPNTGGFSSAARSGDPAYTNSYMPLDTKPIAFNSNGAPGKAPPAPAAPRPAYVAEGTRGQNIPGSVAGNSGFQGINANGSRGSLSPVSQSIAPVRPAPTGFGANVGMQATPSTLANARRGPTANMSPAKPMLGSIGKNDINLGLLGKPGINPMSGIRTASILEKAASEVFKSATNRFLAKLLFTKQADSLTVKQLSSLLKNAALISKKNKSVKN